MASVARHMPERRAKRTNPPLQEIPANVAANFRVHYGTNVKSAQKRPSEADQNSDQRASKRCKTANTTPEQLTPVVDKLEPVLDEMMDIDSGGESFADNQLVESDFTQEECIRETYTALRENEEQFNNEKNNRQPYDLFQQEITHNMRSILVDWLVEVAEEYGLRPQTLFLAVDYLDRFLTLKKVSKHYLQLVGVTCMFIAAKYEEIYPPTLTDFVYITDNTYKPEMIISCEREILIALEFKLTVATPVHFLRKFLHVVDPNKTILHNFAQYALELTLADPKFIRSSPSQLALAVTALAVYATNISTSQLPDLEKMILLPVSDVTGYIQDLYNTLKTASERSFKAVIEKHRADKYESVANIEVSRINLPMALLL